MGAVQAIIGVIAWGYIGLALLCAVAALRLPRTWRGRFAALSCVVVVFGYWPVSNEIAQRKKDVRRAEVAALRHASCALNTAQPAAVRVDQLRLEATVPSGVIEAGRAMAYMFERALTRLEVDARSMDYSLRHKYLPGKVGPTPVYFDFSLSKAGDPACAAFNAWAGEYPAQRLPPLRYRGLQPGACIAIAITGTPAARFVATATPVRRLTHEGDDTAVVELDYVIEDTVTAARIATAFVTAEEGKDGWFSPACVATRARDTNRLIALEDMLPPVAGIAPEVELISHPAPFGTTRAATNDDIERWRLGRQGDERFSTNNIDEDATAWFEPYYERSAHGSVTLRGYFLVSYTGPTIHRTLIRVGEGEGPAPTVTELRVTGDEVSFLVIDGRREYGWLATYSRAGLPLALLALDREQFARLRMQPWAPWPDQDASHATN